MNDYKTITTLTGAIYTVTPEGRVTRARGNKDMRQTAGNFQYTSGVLHYWLNYDDINTSMIGKSFEWLGVVHEYCEHISSSSVVSVRETTSNKEVTPNA